MQYLSAAYVYDVYSRLCSDIFSIKRHDCCKMVIKSANADYIAVLYNFIFKIFNEMIDKTQSLQEYTRHS